MLKEENIIIIGRRARRATIYHFPISVIGVLVEAQREDFSGRLACLCYIAYVCLEQRMYIYSIQLRVSSRLYWHHAGRIVCINHDKKRQGIRVVRRERWRQRPKFRLIQTYPQIRQQPTRVGFLIYFFVLIALLYPTVQCLRTHSFRTPTTNVYRYEHEHRLLGRRAVKTRSWHLNICMGVA